MSQPSHSLSFFPGLSAVVNLTPASYTRPQPSSGWPRRLKPLSTVALSETHQDKKGPTKTWNCSATRISHTIIINVALKPVLTSFCPSNACEWIVSLHLILQLFQEKQLVIVQHFITVEQICFVLSSYDKDVSSLKAFNVLILSHRAYMVQAISLIKAESDSLAKHTVFQKGRSSYCGFAIDRILWYNNIRAISSILWRAWPGGYVSQCNRGLE